jgi:hypothetical protein
MFYVQGHEFPGFSQMIYWGPTRVSRAFQMVYCLASAPRLIHSSLAFIVQPPTPPRTLHSRSRRAWGPPRRALSCNAAYTLPPACPSRHGSTTTTCDGAHQVVAKRQHLEREGSLLPSKRDACSQARARARARLTPKSKRLQCPGGHIRTFPNGFTGPSSEFSGSK